ncbi:hypothetical protein CHGG_07885 [Chaetomium globosum CBS 148.51]|uniref:C2H2-type domain-containing protein n=1 Tax=Chaetomium globosum (strain ATCC 6205 / CBS 148.51 / DSM 1962 / NBRC 6347 / NRRL 1970) TaxID=306901 RepID=Q2GVW9_CHAGB|nr:uncharacterized protein CHGG_07885 [Chaetomium globosum CBS 148.51]EAQ86632.1 hypothetical protein CHGG_07885 [Chaetomium globosum CBS 148.51]
MPYDPDWDLEEETSTNLNSLGATLKSPSEYGSDEYEYGYEEGGGGDEQIVEQERGDAEKEDHMAADLLVSLPRSDPKQNPGQHQDLKPKHQQPFPGASAAGTLPKVEVVLHSSPRRVPLTAPAEELADDFSDEPNLITSDIVPNPVVHHQQPTAKAQVGPPNTQPSVAPAPAPFKLPDITPQPKKRGRPVGWRRGHGSYAAMRSGLPPGSATPQPKPKKPAGEQKPRGRPGRKPAPTARQLYLKLNPHFVAFRCEWEDCPAELQNVETLRRHLLVVHGRPSRSSSTSLSPSPVAQQQNHTITLPCRWASCTCTPLHSRESFASHIDTAHLLPIRWHVGDGPRNTTPPPKPTTTKTTTPQLPTYLFNAAGEQVTPSITTQQIENEDERKRRAARVNRVLLLRDRHAPDEPDYGPRELEIVGEALAAKQKRQRMLREYAERGCVGGWLP